MVYIDLLQHMSQHLLSVRQSNSNPVYQIPWPTNVIRVELTDCDAMLLLIWMLHVCLYGARSFESDLIDFTILITSSLSSTSSSILTNIAALLQNIIIFASPLDDKICILGTFPDHIIY